MAIHWTEREKQLLASIVNKLMIKFPNSSLVTLVNNAQSSFPENRKRKITTIYQIKWITQSLGKFVEPEPEVVADTVNNDLELLINSKFKVVQYEFDKLNQRLTSIEDFLINVEIPNSEITNLIRNEICNFHSNIGLKEKEIVKEQPPEIKEEDTYLELIHNFKSKHNRIKIVVVGVYQDRIPHMDIEKFAPQYADIVNLRCWIVGKGTHSQLKAMCKNADVIYGITGNLSHTVDGVVAKIPKINYIRNTDGISSVKKSIIDFIEDMLVKAI